jgi:hypothetical protein
LLSIVVHSKLAVPVLGGAAAQLALDDAEDAALLAGDEDATWILSIVAAISLVDIGPLDRTSGERLGAVDDRV